MRVAASARLSRKITRSADQMVTDLVSRVLSASAAALVLQACSEPSRSRPRAHGWRTHSSPEGSAIEMKATRRYAAGLAAVVTAATGLLAGTAGSASAGGFPAFVGPLHRTSVLASTVPGNGDVNPYGTFVVPRTTGDLFQGNVLISNFNDKANVQGTGTTIVEVTPSGQHWVFAKINRH